MSSLKEVAGNSEDDMNSLTPQYSKIFVSGGPVVSHPWELVRNADYQAQLQT